MYSLNLKAVLGGRAVQQDRLLHDFTTRQLTRELELRTQQGWIAVARDTDPAGKAGEFNDRHVEVRPSQMVPGLLGVFARRVAHKAGSEAQARASANLGYYTGLVMLRSEYDEFQRLYGFSMGIELPGIEGRRPRAALASSSTNSSSCSRDASKSERVLLVGSPLNAVAQVLNQSKSRANCIISSKLEAGEAVVSARVGKDGLPLPYNTVVLQAVKLVSAGDELTFCYSNDDWDHCPRSCVACCHAVTVVDAQVGQAAPPWSSCQSSDSGSSSIGGRCSGFINGSPCPFYVHRQCAGQQAGIVTAADKVSADDGSCLYCPFCYTLSERDTSKDAVTTVTIQPPRYSIRSDAGFATVRASAAQLGWRIHTATVQPSAAQQQPAPGSAVRVVVEYGCVLVAASGVPLVERLPAQARDRPAAVVGPRAAAEDDATVQDVGGGGDCSTESDVSPVELSSSQRSSNDSDCCTLLSLSPPQLATSDEASRSTPSSPDSDADVVMWTAATAAAATAADVDIIVQQEPAATVLPGPAMCDITRIAVQAQTAAASPAGAAVTESGIGPRHDILRVHLYPTLQAAAALVTPWSWRSGTRIALYDNTNDRLTEQLVTAMRQLVAAGGPEEEDAAHAAYLEALAEDGSSCSDGSQLCRYDRCCTLFLQGQQQLLQHTRRAAVAAAHVAVDGDQSDESDWPVLTAWLASVLGNVIDRHGGHEDGGTMAGVLAGLLRESRALIAALAVLDDSHEPLWLQRRLAYTTQQRELKRRLLQQLVQHCQGGIIDLTDDPDAPCRTAGILAPRVVLTLERCVSELETRWEALTEPRGRGVLGRPVDSYVGDAVVFEWLSELYDVLQDGSSCSAWLPQHSSAGVALSCKSQGQIEDVVEQHRWTDTRLMSVATKEACMLDDLLMTPHCDGRDDVTNSGRLRDLVVALQSLWYQQYTAVYPERSLQRPCIALLASHSVTATPPPSPTVSSNVVPEVSNALSAATAAAAAAVHAAACTMKDVVDGGTSMATSAAAPAITTGRLSVATRAADEGSLAGREGSVAMETEALAAPSSTSSAAGSTAMMTDSTPLQQHEQKLQQARTLSLTAPAVESWDDLT